MRKVLLGSAGICIITLIILGTFKYEKWGMFSPLSLPYQHINTSITSTTTPVQSQIPQKTTTSKITEPTTNNQTGLSNISQDLNSANIDSIGSGLSANSSDSSSF